VNRGNVTGLYVPTPEELRAWADNPAANGIVPVFPATLRNLAEEIERLRAICMRDEPAMFKAAQEDDERMAQLETDARELYEYAEDALAEETNNPRADELRERYATRAVTRKKP